MPVHKDGHNLLLAAGGGVPLAGRVKLFKSYAMRGGGQDQPMISARQI